jgi:O-antigen/teichoic acid export membrane protein
MLIKQSTVFSNALCNILPIASQIAIILFLTPILVEKLDSESFSIWSIVQQAGALVLSVLSVFQVVVSKNVAQLNAAGDSRGITRYLQGTAPLVGRFVVFIVALSAVLSILSPTFLRNVDSESRWNFVISMFLSGCAISFSSVLVFLSGYLQGVSKNSYSSFLQVGSKIAMASGWIAVAKSSGKILQMVCVSLAVAAVTGKIAMIPFARHSIYFKNLFGKVDKSISQSILTEILHLLIWTVSMMFVNGFGVFLVANLDYGEVKSYSIAFALVGGINAIFGAASSALLPMCSAIAVRHSAKAFGEFVTHLTAVNSSMLVLSSIPLLFFGKWVLGLWLGIQVSDKQQFILMCLSLSNLIRNTAAPYAYGVIAAGAQKNMILTPVLEGIATFSLSFLMGSFYGVAGVVSGMVIGSLVGVSLNILINFRRISVLVLDWKCYLKSGLLYPSGILVPFVFLPLLTSTKTVVNTVGFIIGIVISFLSLRHLFKQLSCINMRLKMGSR